MSEEEAMTINPATVVAGLDALNEGGGVEIREEEMGDVESGSELSEWDSESIGRIRKRLEKEVEKRKDEKAGHPNFPRAQPGKSVQQTT